MPPAAQALGGWGAYWRQGQAHGVGSTVNGLQDESESCDVRQGATKMCRVESSASAIPLVRPRATELHHVHALQCVWGGMGRVGLQVRK
eukprot:4372718-Prymnesium_polylepis.1